MVRSWDADKEDSINQAQFHPQCLNNGLRHNTTITSQDSELMSSEYKHRTNKQCMLELAHNAASALHLAPHTVDNSIMLTLASVSVFLRNDSTVLRYVVRLRSTERLKTTRTKTTLVVATFCSKWCLIVRYPNRAVANLHRIFWLASNHFRIIAQYLSALFFPFLRA